MYLGVNRREKCIYSVVAALWRWSWVEPRGIGREKSEQQHRNEEV